MKMEDQVKYEVEPEKKKPIDIDISHGLLPKSYNELLQFAALYRDSGLAPKSFTTVQQLAIGIGMCLELDRPILTGIQDMAVINGRVGIFGDAALAIVRRSGLLEYIKETEEGTPYKDDWTFACTLKRKGAPEPRKGVWTWEDAKRAGFDDPKMRDGNKDTFSPWRRFTRRMMQFKARNFPLRDEFGDVIKGMTLAEELQDIIDVTPEPARTLKVEGGEKSAGPIYDIKGEVEPDPKPQSPPENAATTAPVSGEGKEELRSGNAQPPETKPPTKAKTLFENLMAARGTFCHMVLDNGDLIQNLPPDELRAVKERWAKASAQGIGGITKGDPWPIQEPKEETPLFEIEEGKENQADPFLAKVEQYRKEIDDEKVWDQVLRISGVTHMGISSIPEGEPRTRFLERC